MTAPRQTFIGEFRPYIRAPKLKPITIGIDSRDLEKLRELCSRGGALRYNPDFGGYVGSYGELIRRAVRDFLEKYAPEPKPEKAAKKATAKKTAAKKATPAPKKTARKRGAR